MRKQSVPMRLLKGAGLRDDRGPNNVLLIFQYFHISHYLINIVWRWVKNEIRLMLIWTVSLCTESAKCSEHLYYNSIRCFVHRWWKLHMQGNWWRLYMLRDTSKTFSCMQLLPAAAEYMVLINGVCQLFSCCSVASRATRSSDGLEKKASGFSDEGDEWIPFVFFISLR